MGTSKSWNKVSGIHKLDEILGLENPIHGNLSTKGQFNENEKSKQLFTTETDRASTQHCPVPTCKAKHALWKCPVFQAQSPTEQKETVIQGKLCFNCLRSGHVLAKCTSQSKCKTCQCKHYSVLHESSSKPVDTSTEFHSTLAIESNHEKLGKISLLPTAQVEVLDKRGNKVKLRALLDTCAHISAITTTACKK